MLMRKGMGVVKRDTGHVPMKEGVKVDRKRTVI
jgi:hypothetical protein